MKSGNPSTQLEPLSSFRYPGSASTKSSRFYEVICCRLRRSRPPHRTAKRGGKWRWHRRKPAPIKHLQRVLRRDAKHPVDATCPEDTADIIFMRHRPEGWSHGLGFLRERKSRVSASKHMAHGPVCTSSAAKHRSDCYPSVLIFKRLFIVKQPTRKCPEECRI